MTCMLKLYGSCHNLEVEPKGKSLATGIEFSLMNYYHSVSTLLRNFKKGLISSHFLREWLIVAGSQEYETKALTTIAFKKQREVNVAAKLTLTFLFSPILQPT